MAHRTGDGGGQPQKAGGAAPAWFSPALKVYVALGGVSQGANE